MFLCDYEHLSTVHICAFIAIVSTFYSLLSLLFSLYLMVAQEVSPSDTLAHFNNSTVCLSHSIGT